MAEENLEQLIFFDTNVLLLNSNWNFYDNFLNQYKENSSNLSDIISIDSEEVEKVIEDVRHIDEILNKNRERVNITKGVERQTLGMIDHIVANIKERESQYLFVKFNGTINNETTDNVEDIYTKLVEYKDILLDIKSVVGDSRYQRPKEELYQNLSTFLQGIYHYFMIGKEDPKFDFNTDLELSQSVLYESMKGNRVTVYSNDKDVNESISAAYVLLEELRLLASSQIEPLYGNPPDLYKMGDNKELVDVDVQELGKNKVSYLPGCEEYLNQSQKREYNSNAKKFANFMKGIVEELNENLTS